jgi:tight adherence protein C
MSLFETLTDPGTLIAVGVALASFATIMTLAAPAMRGDKLDARMKSVANRREELRRKSRAALTGGRESPQTSTLRRSDEGTIKKIVDQLQLTRLLEDSTVVDKLAQAGFRGPRPVTTFYFARLITPFVLALVGTIYFYGLNGLHLPPTTRLCAVVALFVAGYYAPNMYVKNRADKRRDSIMQAFPDSLDLLLICVEAGMSIEAAIQKVANEVGSASIELAEELTLLTAELSYLPERRLAYEGLAKRTSHPGVKAVTTAMIQAERYGTPLGAALRVMAKENREMRIASAEKKAAQLPAKLTVPMILFFLPVLFAVILGPSIMRASDTFNHRGHYYNAPAR